MENKGIISILCVEDGSVDIQNLEENGLQDGKVLVYRQGSRPPFVLQLPRNIQQLKAQQTKLAVEKLEELEEWAIKHQIGIFDGTRVFWEGKILSNDLGNKINEMINELKGGAE